MALPKFISPRRKSVPEPMPNGFELPSADWFEQADNQTLYTPDAWLIERFSEWNVFVYGAEQRGLKKHSKLGHEAKYRFTAYSCGYYASWVYNMGNLSFPFAMGDGIVDPDLPWYDPDDPRWAYLHRIKGEIYTIPSTQFFELDEHMLNTVMFERQRRTFEVPYRNKIMIPDGGVQPMITDRMTQVVTAWMYVAVPEFWNKIIDDGYRTKPTKTFRPSSDFLPIFSHFSKLDYDESDNREAHSM